MALLLKNLGFKNVEVLEKTNRIGGKSYTVDYRGAAHDMGTCYTSVDYQDNVIPLIKKYMPDDLTLLHTSSVWDGNQTNPSSLPAHAVTHAMQYFGTNNATEASLKYAQAIKKYVSIHKSLFGDYEGEIMPEPSQKIWTEINGTILDFLKRNTLEVIIPLLAVSHTMMGYGYADEVSCLYGLMWNTPAIMEGLLARMADRKEETGLYVLKSGFQKLWETIVEKENLKVKLNIDIKSMWRSKLSGYKDIWLDYSVSNGEVNKHYYNFLIWSPDMSTSLPYWVNKEISEEQFYFRRIRPTFYSTALVNSIDMKRGESPIDYFLGNINSKENGSLWGQRDTYASIKGYIGQNYSQNKLPNGDDKKQFRTSVTYQMSDSEPSDSELRKQLNATLRRMGATEIELVYFKTWRYFPRFSPDDIEKGYLWRIIEMQGKYGMWYIGSSVSFESVKSVMEYNKMLLQNMDVSGNMVGNIASLSARTNSVLITVSILIVCVL